MKNYLFVFFILFFGLISRLNYSIDESSFIEVIQAFVILLSIIITIKNKKNIYKKGKPIYYLKLIFFSILFYEELSFLTEGLINANTFFLSSELSFRHLNFFALLPDQLITNSFYKSNYLSQQILQTIFLFLLGYGSFFPMLKKYNFIFLERTFSKFTFLAIINLLISFLIKKIFNYEKAFVLINFEYVELYIYLILFFDLNIKVKKLKYDF